MHPPSTGRRLDPQQGDPRASRGGLRWSLLLLASCCAGHAAVASGTDSVDPGTAQIWIGSEGEPVQFSSLQDLERFLQTAEIRKRKVLHKGITDPEKLLLEQDGRRLHAQFQPFDKLHDKIRLADGRMEYRYRDSYKFNIAAWKLGRLLGMGNIPPSFARRLGGDQGSITVWVEGVMTEKSRNEDKLRPPRPLDWSREMTRMRVFDELIANDDRNQGNILIDKDWKVWLIDHTRAFRPRGELRNAEGIRGCERRLWSQLRSVSDAQIEEAVGEWLEGKELAALLARRKLLVEHLETLIASQGEAVLFDLQP